MPTAASMFSAFRLFGVMLPLLGALMSVGLVTMLLGILSCALLIVSLGWLHPKSNVVFAIAASLPLVLMLLGPGAYSLDVRFFGLRRVEVARRAPGPKP